MDIDHKFNGYIFNVCTEDFTASTSIIGGIAIFVICS